MLHALNILSLVLRVHGPARRLATVAEPLAAASGTPRSVASVEQSASQKATGKQVVFQTGIVLNRHPILTRTPTAFERAYYNYHSRIERALHNPFPTEFYFKPGSLLQAKFEEEEFKREKEAFGRMPWLEAGKSKKAAAASDILNEDAVEIMPRENEADRTGDVKSLDRKGARNLYLLVKSREKGTDVWRFPQTELVGEELLHEVGYNFISRKVYLLFIVEQAVQRDLRSPYGEGMDTWVVSRIPMGVYKPPPPPSIPVDDLEVSLYCRPNQHDILMRPRHMSSSTRRIYSRVKYAQTGRRSLTSLG